MGDNVAICIKSLELVYKSNHFKHYVLKIGLKSL